jgi:hypothetical protein
MERVVAVCRWLLAAVAGVLAAQHTSLVMNIVRLTAYLRSSDGCRLPQRAITEVVSVV